MLRNSELCSSIDDECLISTYKCECFINAVTNGYYNDSGQWVQGELDQTLPEGIHSVDKTAEAICTNNYKMKLRLLLNRMLKHLPRSQRQFL